MTIGDGWLQPLDRSAIDASLLGGKGAALARLVALGHLVPPGFVVTASAFQAMLERVGAVDDYERLAGALRDGDARVDLAQKIGDAIDAAPLLGQLDAAIAAEATRLGLWDDNTDGLIVRSSATVEDSQTSSFAGIFDSIAIGEPSAVGAAVKAVWRSAFSPRAVIYAVETGADAAPLMAVVVQRFLGATRSGVMFTTFDGVTLVEHVEGGSEKLVLGETTPDRLTIDRSIGTTEGVRTGLSDEHVASLTGLARRLEDEFGGPQDVEWVIWRDRVHLVQTRPITSSFTSAPSAFVVDPVLTGTAASAGIGAGPTHLVFNIDQALALPPGSILVTPMTNPDMVVAMRASAGIVTDVGGVICHAAIVSRELGLPCVVGTETATTTLVSGQEVTVDGSAGSVYDGIIDLDVAEHGPPAGWVDVWGRFSLGLHTPLVTGLAALEAAPPGIGTVVLAADVDLRSSPDGLWHDLERLPDADRLAVATSYVDAVRQALDRTGVARLRLVGDGLPTGLLDAALATDPDDRITVGAIPTGAVPITEGLVVAGVDRRSRLSPVDEAIEATTDTAKFFGHMPAVRRTGMPDPIWRAAWWDLLPEYGRYHQEFATTAHTGDYDWLEIRPELVISPLLKSLVQPGFEMVPRVLGFADLPPLYVKWIRCRYHFRSDAFAAIWRAIVRATWDPLYMADLNHRVRRSYHRLEEAQVLFPDDDAELRALGGAAMVALLTSWWPRWVEFFALCWFIQAQGDDILYPFIEETVAANRQVIDGPDHLVTWPSAGDLVLPTTPVLSGEYMASMAGLREEALSSGFASAEEAVAAIDRGEAPRLAGMLDLHLAAWHWMRDRDLIFEPWDTPMRVLETALRTGEHTPVPYRDNLERNLFGLGFHADLARGSGRRSELAYAGRMLHDLNVERENHHVLWLRYSYPLRRVFLELERRLIDLGAVEPGDIWFFEAPELIAIADRLPTMPEPDLVARVRNRRRGFEHEARFSDGTGTTAEDEDDYY